MTSGTSRSTECKAKGYLIGLRIVVTDPKDSELIFNLGFYGKPFGIRKPSIHDKKETLELSLIEALYLVEKGILDVISEDNRILSYSELLEICRKRIKDFDKLYKVYKDLRNKGFIVRSGLKFGSDYSLYRQGPGIDHAPFLVHVFDENDYIDPIELVRAGRLSHSVKKKFIIAIVNDSVSYMYLEWYKP